jgi:Glyoxalase/Bleomycin resistance protein/Dioxygenase superfamily
VATQAPQASRWAAPRAAKAAAVATWVYAVCFGLPAIPVAVYLLQTGQLPWLFNAFPMYGGPWYDSGQPERFAAQLGAFVVVMLVVSWGGWLLWRGSRAGAVVAVATIPVDHVSLTVTNLNVSAQFYTEVLGFTVVLDFGYALACIHKTTGFTLSLIRHSDGTGTRFTHRQTGLDHLGLTARNRTELLGWEQRRPGVLRS